MALPSHVDRAVLGFSFVRGVLCVLGAIGIWVAAMPPASVGAQGVEAPPVDADPTAPAVTCGVGGPLEIGVGVDCTVDLAALDLAALGLEGFDAAALELPAAGDGYFPTVGLLDQNGEYWPCEGVGTELICSDIGSERFDLVTRSFDLEIITLSEQRLVQDVAAIETVVDPQQTLFTFMSVNEPVVFDRRPLLIELLSIADLDGVFVKIRERSGADVVASIEVTAPGRDRSVSERLDPELPPGRYRVWACVGPDERTCGELPGGQAFQVIDPELRELVPGHNRPSAQRINVVFAGSEVGTAADLQRIATDMLTLEGPDIGEYDLRYGPMSIEPLASNRHRFNFWYLTADLGNERSLLFDGTDPLATVGFDLDGAPLDNVAITVLYGPGYDASDARITSLWNQVDIPAAEALRFGGARVSVNLADPVDRATTLAHEWGHSLFELRDEYVDYGDRSVLIGYPNCAPSPQVADSWWGTQNGDIDPFVYEVLRARRAAGFSGEPREGNLATNVQIGLHNGGCYDDAEATTAYRPTLDSLMSSEIPVFGSVNRSRVEAILARFSGRGPLDDLDSIDLHCERSGVLVTCGGTLARYLDPPDRRVALDASSCEVYAPIDQSDEGADGLATIRCLARSGSGPVELALGSQRRSVTVTEVPEPEPVIGSAAGSEGGGSSGAGSTDDAAVGEPDREPGSPNRTLLLLGTGVISALLLFRVGWAAWNG